MARVLGSYPIGRWFESTRRYQIRKFVSKIRAFLFDCGGWEPPVVHVNQARRARMSYPLAATSNGVRKGTEFLYTDTVFYTVPYLSVTPCLMLISTSVCGMGRMSGISIEPMQ